MANKISSVLMILLLFVLTFGGMEEKANAANRYNRIWGSGRYFTAVEISKAGWKSGSQNAVLTYGENFPDALCAAPLAKQLFAPILLTDTKKLDKIVYDEIIRLGVKNVYIVGGTGVISSGIENTLKGMGLNCIRLCGDDRYLTSVAVADYMADNLNMSSNVVVATGDNFPDALSIAPIAGIKKMPILLSEKDKLDDRVDSFIKKRGTTTTYIIGGEGVISKDVEKSTINPVRLGGSTRYETNIAVLNKFMSNINFNTTYIATGDDFPDALAGSAIAAANTSPMILVGSTSDNITANFVSTNKSLMKNIIAIGGEQVVRGASIDSLLSEDTHDPAPTVKTGIITATILNIRNGAGLQYDIVTKAAMGKKVTILDSKTGWYKVKLSNGQAGWASADYIKPDTTADVPDDHSSGNSNGGTDTNNPAEHGGNNQDINILANPRATVEQAKNWAKGNGATDVFVSLADIYWRISPKSGVDPVVAYAQSAKETNFGKFTGVLDESFHNPCGLKNSNGGDDYEKDAHKIFSSWEEGIQAHVDHLALYAGAPGYPKISTPDPRHFAKLKGIAVTVDALGGKWAGSPSYGTDIVNMMMKIESADKIDAPSDNNNSNMKPKSLSSNFMWIWKLQNLIDKYGDINNLIYRLRALGITNVCIKFHEGAAPIGRGANYRDIFLKYAGSFKNAGFTVGTWGYNYFTDIKNEADLINQALDNSDYYIFDAESATSGKMNEAEEVCKLIRTKHPKSTIGYSSFPIIRLHSNIPYGIFNKYCDFSSPQCYWGGMRYSVNKCMDEMVQNYKRYGLDKPIYPTIQAYGIDMDSYNIYSKYNFGITGAWSIDSMDHSFENFLNNLKAKK